MTSHRTALVLALAALVFALHALPTPTQNVTPAQAFSVCDIPGINVACDIVNGITGGVKWTFNKATGVVRNAVTKKVIAIVSKLACTAAVGAVTDGAALAAGAAVCATVGSKLVGLFAGKSSSNANNGGAPPNNTNTTANGQADPNPPDSPASVFRTSALAAGAAVFAGSVAHLISSSQAVDLHAGWFQSLFGQIIAYGAIAFAALGLLVTLLVAVPRGDGALIAEGFKGLAEGVAITFGAVGVVSLSLVAVDGLCAVIGGSNLHEADIMMKVFAGLLLALAVAAKTASATGHSWIASLLGTPAWFVALGSLIGTGLTLLDLVIRNLAIFLAMLFLPLAAATRTFPGLRSWSRRLVKFLAAVVVSKLILVIAIAAAAAMILHGGLSGLLYGTLLVLVIGFVPFMLYGLVGLVEHLAFSARSVARGAAGAAAVQSARETVSQRRQEIALLQRQFAMGTPNGWSADGPVGSADQRREQRPWDEHIDHDPSGMWEQTNTRQRFGAWREARQERHEPPSEEIQEPSGKE